MRTSIALLTALLLSLAPVTASAQALIAAYTAYVGWSDIHNSNGQRLTEYWQIIRQDRANYHRFGIRDNIDQWDPLFANSNNRARMEQLLMNTPIDMRSRNLILQGNVLIYVEVFGYGNTITGVRVQIPG